MCPASSPNSDNPDKTALRRSLFGNVGQKQNIGQSSIIKIVEPEVYFDSPPVDSKWAMGTGPQSYVISWDGDPSLAETLQSLAISIKNTPVKQGWKVIYNAEKTERLKRALRHLSELFSTLHEKGWAAGYCHPDNIFIKKDGSVFLADLGFYYDGDPEGSFAPSWMSKSRSEAFFWENDSPSVRQARPGSSEDFKAADTRLLGRIISAVISCNFASKSDVTQAPSSPLAEFWKPSNLAIIGGYTLDQLNKILNPSSNGPTVVLPPPEDTKKSNFKLVFVLICLLIGVGIWNFKEFISNFGSTAVDKSTGSDLAIPPGLVNPKGPVVPPPPVLDSELEKLYQAAINCPKEERIGKFLLLASYKKESSEKTTKVIAVRTKMLLEFQETVQELDKRVHSDPLLEYPTATLMEKLLVTIDEIKKSGAGYEDMKTKSLEVACTNFIKIRIQELRRQ